MPQDSLEKIDRKIRKELDEERYRHTISVSYTASALAMCYETDLYSARLAGLLHDCAKCIPNDKKIRLCERYKIPVTETEKKAPQLLHAKLGAYLAKVRYGVTDPAVIGAIRWHTTGKPDMTTLEKIIYMADYIEPHRNKAPSLETVRFVAFRDLDLAVYLTLDDTLRYLDKGSGQAVDETTVRAYEFYKTLVEKRETLKQNLVIAERS